MVTITEIIARLGHACGLPWAKPYTLNVVDHSTHRVTTYSRRVIPPTLAEWQAEHEREHPGEPGPVASWTGPDGFGWRVFATADGHVGAWVDFSWCGDDVAGWGSHLDMIEWYSDEDGRTRSSFPREIVARIVTLATAAAKAMVGP